MKEFFCVLAKTPLLSNIESQDLETLLVCLNARKNEYRRGEMILRLGDPADRIGIVLKGSVQVIREDYRGNRSMMAKLGVGDMFAEAFACADVAHIPVDVMAAEDTVALMIPVSQITHSCARSCGFHHQLIYNMMKILAVKNLIANQKIEIVSQRSTREKLMTYLTLQAQKKESSDFEIPYNRQELADYLEVDRSGLSVEISKLRREGILNCERNHFHLLRERE